VLERRQAEGARSDLLRRLVDVQEEERSRIARELHDQMGQQLTALKLGLDALDAGDHDEITRHDRLQELLVLTRQIGHDMHRIAWELGPSALDGYDLPTALSSYAEEWSGHSRVPVQLHCSGGWVDRLSSQVEATVYRVVQEALTNVSKHARAERLSLIVDRRDDHLLAIVEDDGVGFDPDAMASRTPQRRGLGLIGMR
jgi:signal transduction histidine kinase